MAGCIGTVSTNVATRCQTCKVRSSKHKLLLCRAKVTGWSMNTFATNTSLIKHQWWFVDHITLIWINVSTLNMMMMMTRKMITVLWY